jgi:hypothetical protein
VVVYGQDKAAERNGLGVFTSFGETLPAPYLPHTSAADDLALGGTAVEARWHSPLSANGRISVAPRGDRVCHAYRRPIVRPH